MTVMEHETTSHITLAIALDQLKQDSFLDGLRLDNLLTRDEWSNTLGIHRSTLHRWEQEIIDKVSPIKSTYFSIKRMRSPYLDAYQRFILALIFIVKGGLERRSYPHEVAITFLKLNFTNLKREQFENWRANNV